MGSGILYSRIRGDWMIDKDKAEFAQAFCDLEKIVRGTIAIKHSDNVTLAKARKYLREVAIERRRVRELKK